jgi:hypothetical protein
MPPSTHPWPAGKALDLLKLPATPIAIYARVPRPTVLVLWSNERPIASFHLPGGPTYTRVLSSWALSHARCKHWTWRVPADTGAQVTISSSVPFPSGEKLTLDEDFCYW